MNVKSIKKTTKIFFHKILNKIASKSKNYQFYQNGYNSLNKKNKSLLKNNKLLLKENEILKNKYSSIKEKQISTKKNFQDLKKKHTDIWNIYKSLRDNHNSLAKDYKNIDRDFSETKYAFMSNLSSKIERYENIHIMHNDKFNGPIINIFNKHCGSKKHFFIFVMKSYTKDYTKDLDEEIFGYNNVLRVNDINFLDLSFKSIKRVILHGLFMKEVIYYLYDHPEVLNKSYWAMWGGDFYFTDDDEKSFYVKQNVKAYLNLIEKDYEIASKKYDFKGEHYLISYPSPISKEALETSRIDKKERDFISIQICNSADFTIIETLNTLKKFKNKHIFIKVILSYGDTEYNEEIMSIGKNIFGNKFSAIMEYIPPNEFAKFIADTDILILSQNRQQGLGNIFATLHLGGKVYIKSDVGTLKH